MALQTNQIMDPAAGLVASYVTAASDPHTIDCANGRTFAGVVNGSGGSINVTLTTPGTDLNGNAIANPVFAVAAGASRFIPLNPAVYGAIASLAFSSTTTITFAAITLP